MAKTNTPHGFVPGAWVQCLLTDAFGIVQSAGAKVSVLWSGGETTSESKDMLTPSTAAQYFERLSEFAKNVLGFDDTRLWALHGPIANGEDKMSFSVLCKLEQKLLDLSSAADTGEITEDFISDEVVQECMNTIETTAETLPPLLVVESTPMPANPFAAMLAAGGRVEATLPGERATGIVVTIPATTVTDSTDPKPATDAPDSNPGPGVDGAANASSTPVEGTATDPKSNTTVDAPTTNSESGVGSAAQPTDNSLVRTEAGLIDPETGEVIEPSLIMRKFGWAMLPTLPENPTKEDIDKYELCLDAVVDVVLGYRERTERYRAAAELRCKPIDSAADYYEKTFIQPMARTLAPFRLKKRGKTMALPSGAINFRQIGGWRVFDINAVRKHIEKVGVDAFKAIGAKLDIVLDQKKLTAALNKGTLTNIPGTMSEEKKPLGLVKVVSPAAKTTEQESEDDE